MYTCITSVLGSSPTLTYMLLLLFWQNDLVHGWGMDMKLGYCAQGDRTRKVGVVDSEYIVHQGIQTLGGASARKVICSSCSFVFIFILAVNAPLND
ncbi:hypothetical protein C3L33_15483, partial [Rhododendron williamsianum]